MLYHLLYPLRETYAIFNVFKYITFRTAYAILTSLAISFALGPWLIEKLKRYPVNGSIREYVPQNQQVKAQTPTMGGILILISIFVPTLLWANLTNAYIWVVLGVTLGMGIIGLVDDRLKLKQQDPKGLSIGQKLCWQSLVGLAAGICLLKYPVDSLTTRLPVPLFKNVQPDLGWFYLVLGILVIVGTSNAINLTDGLDGLAIGPVIIATLAFIILTYVTGHAKFAKYLMISHIPGSGELTIFCGAMLGASLGFLWFNTYPAQVFMGDIGALALGGALGTVALISKHELLLVIIGGVFVIEALSVIIQVASFKLSGKRVFRMAPIHHHFELRGWAEPKIIVRFWIIAIILALVGLSTLKLR
jgi:phospho-N-acetylmuramoyl-pentapeptide-transferase